MNIEQYITKKIDLDNNEGLSIFQNYAAQQSHNAFRVFYDFINDVKPARILEIGTALGGFTAFLNLVCKNLNLDTKILTYDISERPWYKELIREGIDVRVESIFIDDKEIKVKDDSIKFIQQPGTTVVLCDGGYKIGEFNIFGNYIKPGDFILAHDYAKDAETFQNKIYKKIWNWHEIQESDIIDTCTKNNLISYKQDIFDQVVWVCRRKEAYE